MRSHKTMIAIFVLTIWGIAFGSMGFAEKNEEFIPGEESGFYYTIKKGDTLWDLSQKFYNSEWDWPGLWEMNDDIKNPHWIYPGKRIQIFLKGNKRLKPKAASAKNGTVPARVDPSFSFSEMDHVGFIKKTAQTSLGTIIKEEEGNLMMSADDVIYIQPSGKGTLIPGSFYHIYTTETVTDEINQQPFEGVKHKIKAKVKILKHHGTHVTGLITDSYYAVEKDDLVMEYYKRDQILAVEDTPPPIDARLICSEDQYLMINDYRIAFIDAGKAEIKPGQIYTILRKNETKDYSGWKPKKQETMALDDLESGKLIVLHTEDIASTVMILSSKYTILANDIIN